MNKAFKFISSTNNPLIKQLIKLRKEPPKLSSLTLSSQPFVKDENKSIIISGKTLIRELCNDIQANTLLLGKSCDIPPSIKNPKRTFQTEDRILKQISGLETVDGYVAEIPIFLPVNLEHVPSLRSLLVFDHLQDPGNLGTLLRSALAFNVDAVYFLESTVNPFNDKCIRASRGASLRLIYSYGNYETLSNLIKKHKLECFITMNGEEGVSFNKIRVPKNGYALILGNEARGVDIEKFENLKTTNIKIPMNEKVDSLNVAVAGSIILQHFQKNKI